MADDRELVVVVETRWQRVGGAVAGILIVRSERTDRRSHNRVLRDRCRRE